MLRTKSTRLASAYDHAYAIRIGKFTLTDLAHTVSKWQCCTRRLRAHTRSVVAIVIATSRGCSQHRIHQTHIDPGFRSKSSQKLRPRTYTNTVCSRKASQQATGDRSTTREFGSIQLSSPGGSRYHRRYDRVQLGQLQHMDQARCPKTLHDRRHTPTNLIQH